MTAGDIIMMSEINDPNHNSNDHNNQTYNQIKLLDIISNCPKSGEKLRTTATTKEFSTTKSTNGAVQTPGHEMQNAMTIQEDLHDVDLVPNSQIIVTPLDSDNWTDSLPATDHVRLFKSTNWAASALGPLKDWNIALRIHTHTMLADSRSACLYWCVFYVCKIL